MENIRILKTVTKYGFTYERGSCIKAVLNQNDTATGFTYPYPKFQPDEFEIVIPDRYFEELLKT